MAAKKDPSLVLPGRRVFVAFRRKGRGDPPSVKSGKVSSIRHGRCRVALDDDIDPVRRINWNGLRDFDLRDVFRSEQAAWEHLANEASDDASLCFRLADSAPSGRGGPLDEVPS